MLESNFSPYQQQQQRQNQTQIQPPLLHNHYKRTSNQQSQYNGSMGSTRSKRRFSDDEEPLKKKNFPQTQTPTKSNEATSEDYPKFHHPDGGFIQFTPNGTVRTYIRDNLEVSELQNPDEEVKLNFKNVNNGIDGYRLVNLSSPNNSVESYMRNGLLNPNPSQGHYSNYNDFYDCDSDLEDEDEDCQMS